MTPTNFLTELAVSGFSDEIATAFDEQLAVVNQLGMRHVCLRAADGRGIADFTFEEIVSDLVPRLAAAEITVSSIGSPIGKIAVDDDDAFALQLEKLETLCRAAPLLGAKLIRMFSFYIPKGRDAEEYRDVVLAKVREFEAIARRHDVVLVLENEKHLFGDIGTRCAWLLRAINSPHLRAAFDFANFVQCDDDPLQCWMLLRDLVADIHVKDARYGDHRNVLCGTGDGKIETILGDARTFGYRGFLTLEPHLAAFSTFAALERDAASTTEPGERRYANGAEAYGAQYEALVDILRNMDPAPAAR